MLSLSIYDGPIITKAFTDTYANKIPPWGFNGLGEIVYMRTYARDIEELGRKETWAETIARCVNGAQKIGAGYTVEEAERLFDYIFNLKGIFAGRCLWQLGTPLVEKMSGVSLVNCWMTSISKVEDFQFLMDHLMVGGGVGFTVERASVHEFPKVRDVDVIAHEKSNDADFIVPDSRQGWSALIGKVLNSYFHTGESFTYSTTLIRGFGAPLKTFGGTASGPEVLIEGIADICNILDARIGKKIRSVDALDIANIIGKIVVAGSARRSAQIAIGDPDDFLFLRAKNWNRGDIPGWRANSNNSIYADSYDEIIEEFWKGYDGSGEPYGLINRFLIRKFGRLGERVNDSKVIGTNPCGEIGLEDGEPCNLAEIFLPNISSKEELSDISKLLYKTQKAITTLAYPYKKSRDVIERNRRLGQGITGWLQATEDQLSWVSDAYNNLKNYDIEWSSHLGINPSIKLTTVKPSGPLSLLAGVTPGIHPAYSQFYIRRVRMGSNDPLVAFCRQKGYDVQFDIGLDRKENHMICVVSFPCETPEHAVLAKDMSAIDQLEWVVKAQS